MQCNVSAMFHFVAVSVQQKIEHIFLVWGGGAMFSFFIRKLCIKFYPLQAILNLYAPFLKLHITPFAASS